MPSRESRREPVDGKRRGRPKEGCELVVGDVLATRWGDYPITHFRTHPRLMRRIACSGGWSMTVRDDREYRVAQVADMEEAA